MPVLNFLRFSVSAAIARFLRATDEAAAAAELEVPTLSQFSTAVEDMLPKLVEGRTLLENSTVLLADYGKIIGLGGYSLSTGIIQHGKQIGVQGPGTVHVPVGDPVVLEAGEYMLLFCGALGELYPISISRLRRSYRSTASGEFPLAPQEGDACFRVDLGQTYVYIAGDWEIEPLLFPVEGYVFSNGTTIAGATPATFSGIPETLVMRDAEGAAAFTGVVFSAVIGTFTSTSSSPGQAGVKGITGSGALSSGVYGICSGVGTTDNAGVRGVSTGGGYGVYAASVTQAASFGQSETGAGGAFRTASGVYHLICGTLADSVNNRLWIKKLWGALTWFRADGLNVRAGSLRPGDLTADREWLLPDTSGTLLTEIGAHATAHATGGTDPLAPHTIGASTVLNTAAFVPSKSGDEYIFTSGWYSSYIQLTENGDINLPNPSVLNGRYFILKAAPGVTGMFIGSFLPVSYDGVIRYSIEDYEGLLKFESALGEWKVTVFDITVDALLNVLKGAAADPDKLGAEFFPDSLHQDSGNPNIPNEIVLTGITDPVLPGGSVTLVRGADVLELPAWYYSTWGIEYTGTAWRVFNNGGTSYDATKVSTAVLPTGLTGWAVTTPPAGEQPVLTGEIPVGLYIGHRVKVGVSSPYTWYRWDGTAWTGATDVGPAGEAGEAGQSYAAYVIGGGELLLDPPMVIRVDIGTDYYAALETVDPYNLKPYYSTLGGQYTTLESPGVVVSYAGGAWVIDVFGEGGAYLDTISAEPGAEDTPDLADWAGAATVALEVPSALKVGTVFVTGLFGDKTMHLWNGEYFTTVLTEAAIPAPTPPWDGAVEDIDIAGGTEMDPEALADGDLIVVRDVSTGTNNTSLVSRLWTYISGKLAGYTATGAWAFSSTTRPTSAGTGTPAATSLVTQQDIENFMVSGDYLYLRDDFIMNYGDASGSGELGWATINFVGTGTSRPNLADSIYGTIGIGTSATIRGATAILSDKDNLSAGLGGLSVSSFANTRFRMKIRFMVPSLDCGMRVGIGTYGAGNFKLSSFFGVSYVKPSPTWSSGVVVATGEYCEPTVANGRRYYASTGGTTGGSEPTWPTSDRGTVVDNTVTWTEFGSAGHANFMLNAYEIYADQLTTKTNTNVAVVAGTWYEAVIQWVSGTTYSVSINGSPPVNIVSSMTAKPVPILIVEALTATITYLHVDYFMLFTPVTR